MGVTLVLPAYNEGLMIRKMYDVISRLMGEESIEYEIVFVDDGSSDHTWTLILELCNEDHHVAGVHFSRNFGKEAAIFAGLTNIRGDCCIVMDCDLQHPPKTAVEMYRMWEQGYEVVEAVKRTRGRETLFHKISAGIFYKIMTKAVKIDMERASDFKLLDRRVVEALLALPEKNAFFRALSSWVGFKTGTVEFDVHEREAGESKWSLWSLVKYAVTNIAAFSAFPMQCVSVVGGITLVGGVVLAIQTLVHYLTGQAVEGFTTVILLILIIGSLLMISLGIIGYYISKIYEEVKGRPKYIISKIVRNE